MLNLARQNRSALQKEVSHLLTSCLCPSVFLLLVSDMKRHVSGLIGLLFYLRMGITIILYFTSLVIGSAQIIKFLWDVVIWHLLFCDDASKAYPSNFNYINSNLCMCFTMLGMLKPCSMWGHHLVHLHLATSLKYRGLWVAYFGQDPWKHPHTWICYLPPTGMQSHLKLPGSVVNFWAKHMKACCKWPCLQDHKPFQHG